MIYDPHFQDMATEPVNVNEFQELAKQSLPKMYYDFYTGGTEDQYTLKENAEEFGRIIIQPRILRDVSSIDLSTTVLGYNISMPVMIAPTSMQKLANPAGEIATARAASTYNTIMVLSTSSTCSLEEVAACCNAVRFFQLYDMATEPVNVNEFQELAKQSLPKMYYDFYTGGTEDQYTLKENAEEFGRIIIQPRILRDVSSIDLSTTVLGYNISMPVMIAPTSMQKLANPAGEIATARAASTYNTIMVLSTSSTCSLEEVAACCNAVRFFQLYVYKRRDISAKLVQRAENNGYKAIVLTADSPRLGRREADIKNKLIVPQLKNLEGLLSTKLVSDEGSDLEALANATLDASFCWEDITWLKSITNMPILIKGVLTHEDAIKALQVGVAGIIVSNHGGRQLDYSPATISVLEEVVHAVRGKVPVFLDGGVRRGTDIFKAVALGARAVLVGRPVIYGLAAKGEYGVRRVLEMLRDELELTMALSGCSSLKEITRSHVRTKHDQLLSML
ncbi:hypothetical protein PTKIN_Ptkin13bG0097000 [Pterospermum kingtungense]